MESIIKKLGKTSITVEKDYHSSEKEYNKLTIVEEEGTFKTYLSRKPVPIGTELTNREYWIPFSGVLESITFDYLKFKKDYASGKAIEDNAIIARHILNRNIERIKIALKAISEEEIDDNAIIERTIKDRNVTSNKIAEENILTEHFAKKSVITAILADYAISAIKLADNSVTTRSIVNENVTQEKLSISIQSLINNLSKTATFAGIATPTTNPEIPTAKTFYIATDKGIYNNFNGIEVTEDEIVILYFDTTWHKKTTGIASQEKLIELNEKVNSLALGKFYGYFPNSSSLPIDITISGYAYVGLDKPYKIWNFNGKSWSDSGTSIDINDADEEDITRNIDGKLQFKDKEYGDGMGYIILRKNKSFTEQVTKNNTIYEIRYDFNLDNTKVIIPEGCVLKFQGGSLINGTIEGNHTIIEASQVHIFHGTVLKGTWNNYRIYAKWWSNNNNIVGDSISAMVSGNGSYYVEFEANKTYNYTASNAKDNKGYIIPFIKLQYCAFIEVNLNNSKHIVLPNKFTHYTVLGIIGCEYAYIHDGIFVGDRLEHDYSTISDTHEFGYGINICGKKAKVERLNISQFTGDAIIAGGKYLWTEGIWDGGNLERCEILNCELHHCRRQGISYGCSNADAIHIVDYCNIHHIGDSDSITGTAPRSGIDIEPESFGKENGRFFIKNTTIVDCTTNSIICGKANAITHEVNIENSYLKGIPTLTASNKVNIYNCEINLDANSNNTPHIMNAVVKDTTIVFDTIVNTLLTGDNIFQNCTISDNTNGSENKWSSIRKYGGKTVFKDCVLKNIKGFKTESATYGIEGYFDGLASSNSSNNYDIIECTLDNCSGIFSNSLINMIDTKILGGWYLGLNAVTIKDCTFIDVMHPGNKWNNDGTISIINSKIIQNINILNDTLYSLSAQLFNPLNLTNSELVINDNITEENIELPKDLIRATLIQSTAKFNIKPEVTLENIEAYNSVIKGTRDSFNGTGKLNTYITIV